MKMKHVLNYNKRLVFFDDPQQINSRSSHIHFTQHTMFFFVNEIQEQQNGIEQIIMTLEISITTNK